MADIDIADAHVNSTSILVNDTASTGDGSGKGREPTLDLLGEIQTLLGRLGESRIEPVAYDTAWVARLSHVDEELAAQALEWLRAHQLPDGSWGALTPLYHHDRVISTLSALIALVHNGAPEDQPRIRAALPALQHSLARLHEDMAGRTVAFEMLLPSLVAEAKTLGLMEHEPDGVVRNMSRLRDAKLARSPNGIVNRYTTIGYSAEMVGPNGLHLLDLDNLQHEDGSVCVSPAATAFFAAYVRPDPAALQYLHRVVRGGGAPATSPIENFERAWALWNLVHAGAIDESLLPLFRTSLDALESAWRPGHGVAMNRNFLVEDGDDTAVAAELFAFDGRATDMAAIWSFEDQHHFRSYVLESHSSVGTNLHFLGALRQAGVKLDHPAIQKIASYLHKERNDGSFWTDKWHSSPYYTTGHAVIVSTGFLNELVKKGVEWIIATQNPDGSWGHFSPTAEETAYCLQALMTWYQEGLYVPPQVLTRGAAWLVERTSPPYAPMWISKNLYCPTLIVQSAILGALRQYENEFGSLP
jgi:halimadienyl-diphosphate synthase